MQTGLGTRDTLACGLQRAALRIDAEDHDRARITILGQQEHAGRIDREIPRIFALRGLDADQAELPGIGRSGENRDAVMPTVRPVDELARRMDLHFSRVAPSAKVSRQRRDRLDLVQRAL